MELLLLPEHEILNEFFNNHSFSIIEILIFLTKTEKPYKIKCLDQKDVIEFIEIILSIFFEDGTYGQLSSSLNKRFLKELSFEEPL